MVRNNKYHAFLHQAQLTTYLMGIVITLIIIATTCERGDIVGSGSDVTGTPSDADDLHGNTLTVYWFMIRVNQPHSAREIQRRIGLSSNSLVLHHLKKLIDLGLVDTDEFGSYIIVRRMHTGLLELFVGSGLFFFPRHMIYAAICTGFLIPYLMFLTEILNPAGFILLIGHILVTLVFWIETIRIWKLQPI
ncbi:MAG: winged helix-turn-helix domain-containing protein [Candidatus Thorarchaeota archaeon]